MAYSCQLAIAMLIQLPISSLMACSLVMVCTSGSCGSNKGFLLCSISELRNVNNFTLFDEYEIGMLLYDMSEVFAIGVNDESLST